MNLYDNDDGFRQFTLEEANALLPEVIDITESAVFELKQLESQLQAEAVIKAFSFREKLEQESAEILQKWAQEMLELGVYPKGYFTVDFKSPIPDTLFCWTYGEDEIQHIHKTYESFKDRMPIKDPGQLGFEESLN